VTLLSGGFDSPVASYLMSKRGCKQTFAFFYAYPFVGEEVKEKIISIAKVLGKYQRGSKLHIIPFGDIQNLISKKCHEEYRTILFRKYMMDCSYLLADKVKADALLTGDALGQVSSQTIGNIQAIEYFAKKPIFRPLVGFNKIEIINLAREVGTHDISIIPHDDACSLFAPKSPIIRPDMEYFKKFEKDDEVDAEVEKAVANAEIIKISLTGELLLDE
jgi:tRNA uracil 4-sulfurtransferase